MLRRSPVASRAGTMRLLADSFGPSILSHTALVFTHSDGRVTLAKARERGAQIAEVMRGLIGAPAEAFPVYQLDTRVESRPGSTPEYIKERLAENVRSFDALAAWVRGLPPLPTVDFTVGEYAETKRLREEREARERAEAEAKAARDALAAAELARAAAAAKRAEEDAARARDAQDAAELRQRLILLGCVCSGVAAVALLCRRSQPASETRRGGARLDPRDDAGCLPRFWPQQHQSNA